MSIIKWIKDRLGQKKRTLRQSRLEYCLGAMNLRIDELVPIEGEEYESFLSDLKRKVGQLPPEPDYITQDVRMPDGQIIRGILSTTSLLGRKLLKGWIIEFGKHTGSKARPVMNVKGKG